MFDCHGPWRLERRRVQWPDGARMERALRDAGRGAAAASAAGESHEDRGFDSVWTPRHVQPLHPAALVAQAPPGFIGTGIALPSPVAGHHGDDRRRPRRALRRALRPRARSQLKRVNEQWRFSTPFEHPLRRCGSTPWRSGPSGAATPGGASSGPLLPGDDGALAAPAAPLRPAVPILFAAVNRRMLQAAARWGTGSSAIRSLATVCPDMVLPSIAEGAARAGRPQRRRAGPDRPDLDLR